MKKIIAFLTCLVAFFGCASEKEIPVTDENVEEVMVEPVEETKYIETDIKPTFELLPKFDDYFKGYYEITNFLEDDYSFAMTFCLHSWEGTMLISEFITDCYNTGFNDLVETSLPSELFRFQAKRDDGKYLLIIYETWRSPYEPYREYVIGLTYQPYWKYDFEMMDYSSILPPVKGHFSSDDIRRNSNPETGSWSVNVRDAKREELDNYIAYCDECGLLKNVNIDPERNDYFKFSYKAYAVTKDGLFDVEFTFLTDDDDDLNVGSVYIRCYMIKEETESE